MVAQPDLQQLAQAVGHISLERQKEMEAERRQSEISGITLMGESAVVSDPCRRSKSDPSGISPIARILCAPQMSLQGPMQEALLVAKCQ